MALCITAQRCSIPFGVGAAGRIGMGHPDGKIVLAVELLGHALQMAQVDAVAVLQHSVVMISQRGLEHRADADGAARSGTHPYHIVVAPLDIHIVVAHEQIQNDVRAWAAVEQVAHDVQLVHCQMLDQLAQPHDEVVGAAIFNDAAHDLAIVQGLCRDPQNGRGAARPECNRSWQAGSCAHGRGYVWRTPGGRYQ